MKKVINRKQFLSNLSKGAAFAMAYPCLGACTEMVNPKLLEDNTGLLGDVISIDLTDTANVRLSNPGGYKVINNEIVIAQTNNGEYVAATRTCSDEAYKKVIWDDKHDEWLCTQHSATFNKTGEGTTRYNDLGKKGIATYRTSLEGNILKVFIK